NERKSHEETELSRQRNTRSHGQKASWAACIQVSDPARSGWPAPTRNDRQDGFSEPNRNRRPGASRGTRGHLLAWRETGEECPGSLAAYGASDLCIAS